MFISSFRCSLLLAFALVLGTGSAAFAQETLPLGSAMPNLPALANFDGAQVTLASAKGSRGTVVLFASNSCPWVGKYDDRASALAQRYTSRGINFVLVNPGDPSAFPKEAADGNAARAGALGVPYYLSDTSMSVAKAFGAERVPHAFVFDTAGALVYVGSLDDSPGDGAAATKNFLADALDAVVAGQPVTVAETKAFGCMIKY